MTHTHQFAPHSALMLPAVLNRRRVKQDRNTDKVNKPSATPRLDGMQERDPVWVERRAAVGYLGSSHKPV